MTKSKLFQLAAMASLIEGQAAAFNDTSIRESFKRESNKGVKAFNNNEKPIPKGCTRYYFNDNNPTQYPYTDRSACESYPIESWEQKSITIIDALSLKKAIAKYQKLGTAKYPLKA